MKCIFCKGKAVLKYETIELLDSKVVLKQQPFYKCLKCKKEFVTSRQMHETEKRFLFLSQ